MHGYGSLSFFSIVWFFVWVLWIFLLFRVISDVFRSADLTGSAKALWTLLLVIVPFIGVLLYLVARGSEMHVRENQHAVASQTMFRHYIEHAASPTASSADELTKLASLRDSGVLTADEFTTAKARVLAQSTMPWSDSGFQR
jgi:hypothetical protein